VTPSLVPPWFDEIVGSRTGGDEEIGYADVLVKDISNQNCHIMGKFSLHPMSCS